MKKMPHLIATILATFSAHSALASEPEPEWGLHTPNSDVLTSDLISYNEGDACFLVVRATSGSS